jgi:hypothetical protein
MSINKTLFFGALLVCTVFGVNEASKAQYDEEERQICDTPPHGFATVVDGERRIVPFEIVDGQAVVEGDIVIGQEDDLPGRAGYAPVISEFVNDQRTRWPKAVGVSEYMVPFTVDDKLIEEARLARTLKDGLPDYIRDAIAEWEKYTAVRFRPIGGPKDWRRDDYVKFMDDGSGRCYSNSIGVHAKHLNSPKGEEANVNFINLSPGCRHRGVVAHEIAHALGLFHEQTRADRDEYVEIIWKNIKDGAGSQFCKARFRKEYNGGVTLPNTNYDYDSIMHYGRYDFAKPYCDLDTMDANGKCLTIRPNQERLNEQERLLHRIIEPGQRGHLSAGDIWLVNYLYPPDKAPPPAQQSCVTISTKTTVTDRNGTTTTSTTTTSTSGNCAPDRHTRRPGKSDEHRVGCPVRCCWPPDGRCCHRGWCPPGRYDIGPWYPPPRRYEIGPWYPPPPPWAEDFWPRNDFDYWDDW